MPHRSLGFGDSRLREHRGTGEVAVPSVWCCRVRCFRRSAGTFDRKPRGRETEPSDCFQGRAVSSSHLKAVRTGFVRVASKKFFFRSSFHVSSSHFKAVWMGFVRVVSKKSFRRSFRVSPSHLTNGIGWIWAVRDRKNLWTR